MVSDYAVGRHGWVHERLTFLGMSIGCLMLLLGLARTGPSSVIARLGTLLLGVVCIGLVVSAIFPTDRRGRHRTARVTSTTSASA